MAAIRSPAFLRSRRRCFIVDRLRQPIRLGFITRSADTNTGPVYCWIIDAAMDRMTAAAISHVDITNKLQHGTVHSPARSVSSGTISSSIQLIAVHPAPCQDYELHFH